MGNKLCCDSGVPNQLQNTQETPQVLIENFMNFNPAIKQLCSNPGQIYATVTHNVTHFRNGTYIGRISNKQRNELGLMMFKDGMYYQGEWLDNYFSGRGKFFFSNGDFYEGHWKKGLPEGIGLYVSRNPIWRYQGNWQMGLQNGKGKQIFQDGSYYQGDFHKGLRHGKGKFRNHDGRFYEGSFVNGQVQGSAKACDFNYLYDGEWKKGMLHGTGRSQWQNDRNRKEAEYIGEYNQGKKSGFGQYRQKDGVTFKGYWKDGYITNVGIIIQTSHPKSGQKSAYSPEAKYSDVL